MKKFAECWLKSTNFQSIKKKGEIFQIQLVQLVKKIRSSVDIILYIALEKVEYNRLYLIR